jgi:hypothetical protein
MISSEQTHLQTNGHDDIRLTLLWFVRLDTGVDEVYELVEYSLQS